jgi:hypothetical protein
MNVLKFIVEPLLSVEEDSSNITVFLLFLFFFLLFVAQAVTSVAAWKVTAPFLRASLSFSFPKCTASAK